MSFPETERLSIKFVSDQKQIQSQLVCWKRWQSYPLFWFVPESWHEMTLNFLYINNIQATISAFWLVKVHLTPKYFFRLNNSVHLFETHCAFLHLFSPNLDFLQAVKVTKSDHHLFHDRASKGYGSIPGLMSQTYLHACLQRLNTMQISLWRQPRNRPIPLTSSVVQQMLARFRNFYSL